MLAFLSRLLFNPGLRSACMKTGLLLCAAMFITGLIPGARAEVGRYAPGVVLHGLTYAFLTLLWFLGSSGRGVVRAAKTVLAIAMIGAGDEFVQSFLPYRSAELQDWIADLTAALITSTVLVLLERRHEVLPAR